MTFVCFYFSLMQFKSICRNQRLNAVIVNVGINVTEQLRFLICLNAPFVCDEELPILLFAKTQDIIRMNGYIYFGSASIIYVFFGIGKI